MNDFFDDNQIALAKRGCTSELALAFHGMAFKILSDDSGVLNLLRDYFSGLTETGTETPTTQQRVYLVNKSMDTSKIHWTPVERIKASSLGLKEAYADVPGGRWIHKVRTGMVMFQALTDPIIFGDLREHISQVINFINNQFLNYQQRQGYLLGHASAFNIDGSVTAIAASSGGGKSTLMLKALEADNTRFLSNDRILFKVAGDQVRILGLAKHPRVNPGTLINSQRLQSILPESKRKRFEGMPQGQLWDIEQKYDVLIPQAYGEDKAALSGRLKNLVLLDWTLGASEPTALSTVDIRANPEALEGLRKSPGPFFQQADGRFPPEQSRSADIYVENLRGVQIWRLAGKVDFERAIALFHEKGVL
ncbi:HprK-related kinase B [Marinobacter sp. 1_MG-2023]|uniref:HprK-related kinase B n=1 Tax=Marinobacter sp. 1_MG-2023 TaxID=3062627 RepID=UPI0026E26DC2|nr:HprK-related kinase B [Marinobacter sp. 1_MG-2023]MDO6824211.1 HprK-related kinase B [Marinobacter sp. 1_MG-2023]